MMSWRSGFPLLIFLAIVVSGQRHQDHKFMENGILSYDRKIKKPAMDSLPAMPLWKSYELPQTVLNITSDREWTITGYEGSRVTIPENAFQGSGKKVTGVIEVRLTEVLQPVDFLLAGIGLEYRNSKGQLFHFESAGMLKIEAFENGRPLSLRPGVKLQVMVPGGGSKGFDLYSLRDGQWKAEMTATEKTVIQPTEGGQGVSLLMKAGLIDNLGWLNFDKPKPEIACLKGTIKQPAGGGKLQVISLGLDHRGYFSRLVTGSSFSINVHKSAKVRVIIVDEKNNMGFSADISTPSQTGFDMDAEGPGNHKQEIGELALKPIPADVLKNKYRLQQMLNLPRL